MQKLAHARCSAEGGSGSEKENTIDYSDNMETWLTLPRAMSSRLWPDRSPFDSPVGAS